jgi:hypothetical protein
MEISFPLNFATFLRNKNEIVMATKSLKRLKKQSEARPAAIAMRLRKKSRYVMIAYLVPAVIATGMIIAKFWVPGMAWLQ